jgi:hypothetical protein
MGTLRGDNGGGERPQEGGGLPDLPPEWGTIIVPDDPGALDDEGAAVRRLFRREAFLRRWRRRLHLKSRPLRRAGDDPAGLAVPLLIMAVAVIATLSSLFAVAWPSQRLARPTPPAARSPGNVSLAEIGLTDAAGTNVPIRDVSPAVIVLVDGCGCQTFITATFDAVNASRPAAGSSGPPVSSAARAATPGPAASAGVLSDHLSVLVVDTAAPPVPALSTPVVPVRALADPNHSVRAAVQGLTPPVTAATTPAAVLLVDRHGIVVRVVSHVSTVADFRDDLSQLW